MKKLFFIPMLFLALSNSACSDSKNCETYKCPMECEGTKTYDKPGSCPVCGMDLECIKEKK